jgi:hypothetical protein
MRSATLNRMRLAALVSLAGLALVVACGARSPLAPDLGGDVGAAAQLDAGANDATSIDAPVADGALGAACAPGQGPTRVGPNLGPVIDLALDDDYVYVAVSIPRGDSIVYRVAKVGGEPLIYDQRFDSDLGSIALSDNEILWTSLVATTPPKKPGILRARRIDGTTPTRTLAVEIDLPLGLAVFGQDVYVGSGDDSIFHVPRAGGVATSLTRSYGTRRIIADASSIFFDDGRGLLSMALDGSRLTMIAPDIQTFTADATTLFFPGVTNNVATIKRREKAGGPVVDVAPGSTDFQMAVDDSDIYWIELTGVIVSAPKRGGTARVIATHGPTEPDADGLVLDATCVYWAAPDGGVMKAAKR